MSGHFQFHFGWHQENILVGDVETSNRLVSVKQCAFATRFVPSATPGGRRSQRACSQSTWVKVDTSAPRARGIGIGTTSTRSHPPMKRDTHQCLVLRSLRICTVVPLPRLAGALSAPTNQGDGRGRLAADCNFDPSPLAGA